MAKKQEAPVGPRLLRRRLVDFGALLATIARSGARGVRRDEEFRPLGVDGAFELYRWVVVSVTGKGYDRWSWPTRWGTGSLCANFGGRPNCTGSTGATPIRGSAFRGDRHQDAQPPWGWRRVLADRFAHVLLDGDEAEAWRRANNVDLAKPRAVPMLVYDRAVPPPGGWSPEMWRCGTGFGGEVDRLFSLASPARRIVPQLNQHWPQARYLTAVLLVPRAVGWVVETEYGFGGSRWDGPSVSQRKGEPFVDFIYRARVEVEAILTPPCSRVRCSPPCAAVARGGDKQCDVPVY